MQKKSRKTTESINISNLSSCVCYFSVEEGFLEAYEW